MLLRIVRRAMKNTKVVGGGGAIEMELSRYLREYARTISGKQQLVINYFARALEARMGSGEFSNGDQEIRVIRECQVIPMTLAQNSGADGTKVLNQLRQKHATAGPEGRWFGVDCINCEARMGRRMGRRLSERCLAAAP